MRAGRDLRPGRRRRGGGLTEHGLAHEALVIIGGGVVVGVLAGAVGGRLVALAMGRDTVAAAYEQMALVALWPSSPSSPPTRSARAGSSPPSSGGLVAAGPLGDRRGRLTEFMDEDGQLLSFAVFFVFGILAASVLDDLTWAVAGYAVLSLTVVRMVPVALAMVGSGLRPPTVAFMGWFGPRGIASIALLFVVISEEPGLPGHGDDRDDRRRDRVAQHRAPRRECRAARRPLRRLGPNPARPLLRAHVSGAYRFTRHLYASLPGRSRTDWLVVDDSARPRGPGTGAGHRRGLA